MGKGSGPKNNRQQCHGSLQVFQVLVPELLHRAVAEIRCQSVEGLEQLRRVLGKVEELRSNGKDG